MTPNPVIFIPPLDHHPGYTFAVISFSGHRMSRKYISTPLSTFNRCGSNRMLMYSCTLLSRFILYFWAPHSYSLFRFDLVNHFSLNEHQDSIGWVDQIAIVLFDLLFWRHATRILYATHDPHQCFPSEVRRGLDKEMYLKSATVHFHSTTNTSAFLPRLTRS